MKKNKKQSELNKKISLGLELSYKKLLEEKKRNNAEIVVLKDGKIVNVKFTKDTITDA